MTKKLGDSRFLCLSEDLAPHFSSIYSFWLPNPFANATILGKFGVPKPVTASHPSCTGNPVVLHPPFPPLRISVNPLYPFLYSHGFRKPIGALPEEMRASFTRAMTLDIRGVEAEVPLITLSLPFQTTADWFVRRLHFQVWTGLDG
jgi:hypothetical protein